MLWLLVSLTACPYKGIYKALSKEQIYLRGIKVSPATVFYSSSKKISTCDAGIRLENQTDSIQAIFFSDAFLTNSKKKLGIEAIYSSGTSFPIDHTFRINPKDVAILGLVFRDSTKNFNDTINVDFGLSDNMHYNFLYTKNPR